ncbi:MULTISPECIES: hypothetical protein [Enterobacteriaceae]|uniref:hypothetical protein n=1 Tax=Enterobacteriaceae TaxID=543 RepID=UPI000DF404B4|nr:MULTISPECIES: hypothetical protein [Klebsiella]ELB6486065.1 hypothetical protein [Raoultella ornithinolytica]RDB01037.1 hypothetical protein DVB85_07570 [Klebsiella oxytoca]MBZ7746462.1 hypothetical protein [Klebsiella michiganensis]TYE60253.1 hypothetical protein DJ508_08770 [Klebsiella michiganensis]WBT18982.1 hypothetical protein PF584_07740 [Klebsiella michiganensis]
MKKPDQQSRSGWGGKRAGAGAPYGNTNAVKHGERSRRAFFPLEGADEFSPLLKNRIRNLMLAEHLGLLIQSDPEYGTEAWREMTLLYGMMGLHTDRIMRLELMKAKAGRAYAKRELQRIKKRSVPGA